eukprot:TRINITY_DN6182_c0_g1_i1.p1 TRINITY_DN6182_c0_g1~~TRINITY_DN6182_c0_g1_i1.p1  ORF type:complete len:929 (+),score=180.28 TRINITY_DN6182_c0_g1_i1:138-2789(+)
MAEYFEHKVQYIIDNMIADLAENPTHTFIYAETSFFSMWWEQHSNASQREQLQQLVDSGRWEFVSGGWVMNDEATTTAVDIVNQMQEGHHWLQQNLGVAPRIAFQIDPFGHSNMYPHLMNQMCMDALIIDRIPWQDKVVYQDTKNMEFLWRGSASFGKASEITVWTCPIELYSTPPWNDYWNEVTYENVASFAGVLADTIAARQLMYSHPHQLFLFGGDFEFTDPAMRFGPFDLMIDYINAHSDAYGMHLHYSTLSEYFRAVHEAQVALPIVEQRDYFPYSFLPLAPEGGWWSGYYTSWPIYKGQFANASCTLYRAETTVALYGGDETQLVDLRQQQALTLHHDCITGTSKPYVMEDWSDRVTRGERTALSGTLASLAAALPLGDPPAVTPTLSSNLTDITGLITQGRAYVPVIVYNPNDFTLSDFVISAPVPGPVSVLDSTSPSGKVLTSTYEKGKGEQIWKAKLPPFGFETFFLRPIVTAQAHNPAANSVPTRTPAGSVYLTNSFYEVEFSLITNRIQAVTVAETYTTLRISSDILYYDGELSGAYKFHPVPDGTLVITDVPRFVSQVDNGFVSEITVEYASNILETWRLRKSTDPLVGKVIEVEHTLGPDLGGNVELVFRLTTEDVKSNGTLFTTNNELEAIERHYDDTLPTPENYFPMSGPAWIADKQTAVCLLPERAHGIATLGAGTVEVMIGRHTLQDDFCGLGMPLEDTTKYTTKLGLLIDSPSTTEQLRHRAALAFRRAPALNVVTQPAIKAPSDWISTYRGSMQSLCEDMPANVHIFTLMKTNATAGVLRLQHMFEVDAHSIYSQPVTVSLDDIFLCSNIKPTLYEEVTLSDMLTLDECQARRWAPTSNDATGKLDPQQVTLQPMQIRTFRFTL